MNEPLEKIKKAFQDAKSALVCAHEDPDGDTIGSMIATALLLKKLNVTVAMYSPDPVPQIYHFLPHVGEIQHQLGSADRFDIAVAVDAGDVKRTRLDLKAIASMVINIDHHPDNTLFGDINFVKKASSAAELIYKLGIFLDTKLDSEIAEALYAAIITDTGNFRYENTSEETFRIASELVKAGVNPDKVSINIYDKKTLSSLKILAEALRKMGSQADGKIVWSSVDEKMINKFSATSEDLTGIVDHLRSIGKAEVAMLFREVKGKVKVNFRSKEKVNVSEIARYFGGGGHIRAAGCVIPGKLNKAIKQVLTKVSKSI